MDLQSYTTYQLFRIYNKIWDRIGSGGCFGWDLVTLKIIHPHFYYTLSIINAEVNRR